MILTFVRSGEIRVAKWEEIDFDKAQWRIRTERIKMKDPHIVLLCSQGLEILKQLQPITGHYPNGLMFPSQKTTRVASIHGMLRL